MTKGRKKLLAVLIGAVLLELLAVGVIWRLAFQPRETSQPGKTPPLPLSPTVPTTP